MSFHGFAKAVTPAPIWRAMKQAKARKKEAEARRNERARAAEYAELERTKAADFYRAYFAPKVESIYSTVQATGEFHNFTYELTERNLGYLVETISCALGRPREEIAGFIQEAQTDTEINAAALATTPKVKVSCPFGRRLGWYAIARALKPRVIVETGVERGHGSLILCAALLRNASDGSPGRYFGTDIRPEAGQLLAGKYASMGQILYGDSIESLTKLEGPIDLFINDSDHSADYEYREYKTVAGKLSPRAIILGDNAHVTDKLMQFSREAGRQFLFFKEEPLDHWYPGAGIGISFPK